MKNKRKITKKFLILIVILISIFIIREKYYDSNFNKQAGGTLYDAGITTPNTNYDLEEIASSNTQIKKIIDNKEKYPKVLLEMLSRNMDMLDYVSGYLDSKGKVTCNNIGEVKKGTVPLLLQYDTRWGYGMYGNDVIAIEGCGPTVVSMVIAGLTGKNNITPYDVAKYAYQNGYYDDGTSWTFFTKGIKHYGIIGTELPLSKERMMSELNDGHPIILSVRKGDFTTTGHIILITGSQDGMFIVNDPNSRERSSTLWSYDRIKNQINNLWACKAE